MTEPASLGLTEYQAYCALLGQPVNEALTPVERATALPSWLTPELIATEAARTRLRQWADLGRPTPSRRVLTRDLCVVGLSPLRPMIVSALRRCPPPVQHHVLFHCWILGLSRDLAGSVEQSPPPPRGPLQLIQLAGALDAGVLWAALAHEVSHSWLLATWPIAAVPSLHERREAASLPRRLAVRWRRPDLLATEIQRDIRAAQRVEVQAARLARSWGFSGFATDEDYCERTAAAAVQWPW